MSDITEYWIGENVDYSKLWNAYNSGIDGYEKKFHSMQVSSAIIEFDLPHAYDPLFNLEAIYKTLKGLYFDFKSYCLTSKNERDEAGPLFVHSIGRGSGHWVLLIEKQYIELFMYVLGTAYYSLGLYSKLRNNLKSKPDPIATQKILEDCNSEREKRGEAKIDPSNVEKLIQEKKIGFENLIEGQQLKKIVYETRQGERLTIYFDNTSSISVEPKKPEPPTRL